MIMRFQCLYLSLIAILFACKKNDNEINPVDQCLTPTEVIIQSVPGETVLFTLVGTDSLSIGKVLWTIIGEDQTIQIETNGKISVKQNFLKSGDIRVTAIVETVCKTKITLTRGETVQIGKFNKLWIKEIGEYTDTTFTTMIESIEGGCIVAGIEITGLVVDQPMKIISLDASGNIRWKKEIKNLGYKKVKSILMADDGGYVLGIENLDFTYGLMKISADGNKTWEKTFTGGGNPFNGDGYDRLAKILNASDGGYILAGYSSSLLGIDKSEPPKNPNASLNYTLTDYWIIKVNAQGLKEWDRTLGGDGEENLDNIIATPDGGYVLCGTSSSIISGDKSNNSEGGNDTWIVKISSRGVKLWDRSFIDYAMDIVSMPDGSIVLNTWPTINNPNIGYSKLNKSGNLIWQKYIQGDYAKLLVPNDGGFMMVGKLDKYNVMSFSQEGEIKQSKYIDLAGSYFSFLAGLAKSTSNGFYGLVSSLTGEGTYKPSVIYIK